MYRIIVDDVKQGIRPAVVAVMPRKGDFLAMPYGTRKVQSVIVFIDVQINDYVAKIITEDY